MTVEEAWPVAKKDGVSLVRGLLPEGNKARQRNAAIAIRTLITAEEINGRDWVAKILGRDPTDPEVKRKLERIRYLAGEKPPPSPAVFVQFEADSPDEAADWGAGGQRGRHNIKFNPSIKHHVHTLADQLGSENVLKLIEALAKSQRKRP